MTIGLYLCMSVVLLRVVGGVLVGGWKPDLSIHISKFVNGGESLVYWIAN